MINFNSHTHQENHLKPYSQIFNLDIRSFLSNSKVPDAYCSIGIHPWYIQELNIENAYETVEKVSSMKQVLSLGEIGLDRAINVPFELQEKILEDQIVIAIKNNISSLTIHCVRAYPEIISILKRSSFDGNVIFHDFNGNQEIIERLLKTNSFFSFGKKLFQENTKGHKFFTKIPKDRLLLETDDLSDKTIQDIYKKASELLTIDIQELDQLICSNAQNAFKVKLE